jgi:DinB family protein
MGEIEDFQGRVAAVRRGYVSLPHEGWGQPGPVDERTGERWDRGNVLGHVAEMLPFWIVQLRAVVDGGTEMGRDAIGLAQRRMGIDSGREAGEDGLLARIDQGAASLEALLADMRDADLDRQVRFRGADGPERDVDVRWVMENILVGHLEEHLEQVRAVEG